MDMVSIAASIAAAALAAGSGGAETRPDPLAHVRDVSITVVASPAIAQALIDVALAEAAAIWRPAGVALMWRRVARAGDVDAAPLRDVILTVDDARTSVPDGQTALGWIRFTGPAPEPAIHLSRANAEDLMARTANLHDKPTVMQERLVGRALGRALAHELGHYLFKSPAHRPAGLMRAVRPSADFFSPDRNGFDITTAERASLGAPAPCLAAETMG